MTPGTTLPPVGFIGLGDQGLPMAVAIAEAGYPLHVWARTPSSLEELGETERVAHTSVESLAAASDIVGLCVSTDDDVLDLAKAGLLAGLGAGGVLVNHGTGTPATAVELNRLCQEVGASALDAPVSGGRRGAEAKTLTTLVGGPPETAKRCEPVFRTFSEHVVYLGGPGKGQTAKLFNNALLILNQASIAEVIGLSERFDVEPMAMVEVLRLGSGSSRALHHINTIMRPDTVEHLSMLLDLDLDIFQAALRDQQVAAGDLIARGRAGIAGLPDLIERLNR